MNEIRPGEVWDDTVPPGGWVCRECGTPTESEPCGQHSPEGATQGTVLQGPPGPPTHFHDDGTQCWWTRHRGADQWRNVTNRGHDLGPCPDRN